MVTIKSVLKMKILYWLMYTKLVLSLAMLGAIKTYQIYDELC